MKDYIDYSTEEWRDIVGFAHYQVSNFGRVKSFNYLGTGKEHLLKLHTNKKGYLMVGLYNGEKQKHVLVSRIVAQAFIPNPDNLPQVDHIDTNRTNNRVENLRWATNKQNCNNPLTIDKYKKRKPNYCYKSVLCIEQNITFKNLTEAANYFNLSISAVSQAASGKTKSAGGYHWRYI